MGLKRALRRFIRGRKTRLSPRGRLDGFATWQKFNAPSERRRRLFEELAKDVPTDIKFSFVVPATLERLDEMLESLIGQSYRNFEIILLEEEDSTPELRRHDKIRKVRVSPNLSSAAAFNLALGSATCDFIIPIEEPGRVHGHALLLFADYVVKHPATDLLYGDDALASKSGALSDPRFKPDWSPELLLSAFYTAPFQAFRTSLVKELCGCRPEIHGAELYDLSLRLGEKARHVGHIPQILFTRVQASRSSSETDAAYRALDEAFARRGVTCRVAQPRWAVERGDAVYVPQVPDEGPAVTLLIATKNNLQMLDRLLQSLKATTYRNYKIVIVDNMSDDADTVAYLKSLPHQILHIPNPGDAFNYAHINNQAALQADTEFVLFLNDDMSVIEPSWLSQMIGWARLPGIGAVGARLLFPDGSVQHGGVVLGLRKGLTAFRGLPGDDPGYLDLAKLTRDCSAVTAAAMLTPRALFLELGGFDEEAFAVSYNDVDYCLKLGDAGHRVVYCGEAELYHHQGFTRGSGKTSDKERSALAERHGHHADPYYSPHLGLDGQCFAIKPCVVPPIALKRKIKLLVVKLAAADISIEINNFLSSIDTGSIEAQFAASIDQVDVNGFDVVCAVGVNAFAAIDTARRLGVPSVWLIGEEETRDQSYLDLNTRDAARAEACFNFPYRVLFASERARRRFAHLNGIDNFDVIDGRVVAKFGALLESAAFSAVPA
jgi:GT2 family glycosyltransferase